MQNKNLSRHLGGGVRADWAVIAVLCGAHIARATKRVFQLLMVLLAACASHQSWASDCQPLTTEEVLQAENLRLSSQMKNDLETLSGLLDEQLVYVRNSGVVDSKVSYLESLRRGETVYDLIEHTNHAVRLYGCVAILSGQGRYDVRIADKSLTLMLRYHSLWQKKQAKLSFVSWQATRVPP